MSFTKKLIVPALAALFALSLFAAAPASAQLGEADPVVTTGTRAVPVDAAEAERLAEVGNATTAFSGPGVAALGKAIGLGLVIIGAGRGIGMIGSHAVDATARQPEMAGNIFQSSIILAALIEGATLFAIVAVAFFF